MPDDLVSVSVGLSLGKLDGLGCLPVESTPTVEIAAGLVRRIDEMVRQSWRLRWRHPLKSVMRSGFGDELRPAVE